MKMLTYNVGRKLDLSYGIRGLSEAQLDWLVNQYELPSRQNAADIAFLIANAWNRGLRLVIPNIT